jgi:hypothetical protein
MGIVQYILVDGKSALVKAWSAGTSNPSKSEISFMMRGIVHCKRTKPGLACIVNEGVNTLELKDVEKICRPHGDDCSNEWDITRIQEFSLFRKVENGDYTVEIMDGVIK